MGGRHQRHTALWLSLDNIFYLFNFTYIGTALDVGLALYASGYKHARMAVQLAVGLYIVVYLGIIDRENMQLEGFWYYLFSGTFQAAVIHYLVAKIAEPLLFGRGWCGYACWTAMVLDLLPFKTPAAPRREKLENYIKSHIKPALGAVPLMRADTAHCRKLFYDILHENYL